MLTYCAYISFNKPPAYDKLSSFRGCLQSSQFSPSLIILLSDGVSTLSPYGALTLFSAFFVFFLAISPLSVCLASSILSLYLSVSFAYTSPASLFLLSNGLTGAVFCTLVPTLTPVDTFSFASAFPSSGVSP